MSPVYEFKCPGCAVKLDQRRAIDDESPAPMCGDCLVSMERVFSATPVHFKGSGFYKTDSRR
jgi:putative FmdB family regulatory protein